ncbi:MAG: hypothetical protein JRJ86_22560 [Deltaproteobacteria bacterium]|nr:hypothetical protein [Deltaproteobacteria bacterium]
MKKISALDRLLLLITGLIAAYQVVAGMDGCCVMVTIYYTIAFGVLVLTGLLLIIFGFEILDNLTVVVAAALLPLSLSSGLIYRYIPGLHIVYLIFAVAGLLLILVTRYYIGGKIATIVPAIVHGVAGMVIFILPISLSIKGLAPPLFSLVGIGGALIGVGGLLLAFLKAGKPILSKELIYSILPGLLLVMTIAFVVGMAAEG